MAAEFDTEDTDEVIKKILQEGSLQMSEVSRNTLVIQERQLADLWVFSSSPNAKDPRTIPWVPWLLTKGASGVVY